MSGNKTVHYVLVVEWDDTVERPPVVVHHELTLPVETKQEELERFVSDTILPKLTGVSTRAGAINRAYLLRPEPRPPGRFVDLDTPLPNGVKDEVRSFRVIGLVGKDVAPSETGA